jgi:hypothetical protein
MEKTSGRFLGARNWQEKKHVFQRPVFRIVLMRRVVVGQGKTNRDAHKEGAYEAATSSTACIKHLDEEPQPVTVGLSSQPGDPGVERLPRRCGPCGRLSDAQHFFCRRNIQRPWSAMTQNQYSNHDRGKAIIGLALTSPPPISQTRRKIPPTPLGKGQCGPAWRVRENAEVAQLEGPHPGEEDAHQSLSMGSAGSGPCSIKEEFPGSEMSPRKWFGVLVFPGEMLSTWRLPSPPMLCRLKFLSQEYKSVAVDVDDCRIRPRSE